MGNGISAQLVLPTIPGLLGYIPCQQVLPSQPVPNISEESNSTGD